MIQHIKWVLMIFVASCAINTPSANKPQYICDIIYGHENDWNVISDDLARNIYEHNLNCEKLSE